MHWTVYYWNKHEYCWKWLGSAYGYDPQQAIQDVKRRMPEFVKEHVIQVRREWNV